MMLPFCWTGLFRSACRAAVVSGCARLGMSVFTMSLVRLFTEPFLHCVLRKMFATTSLVDQPYWPDNYFGLSGNPNRVSPAPERRGDHTQADGSCSASGWIDGRSSGKGYRGVSRDFRTGMGRKDAPLEGRRPLSSACYPQLAAACHKWDLRVEALLGNETSAGGRDQYAQHDWCRQG